jgi:hypothetical protein
MLLRNNVWFFFPCISRKQYKAWRSLFSRNSGLHTDTCMSCPSICMNIYWMRTKCNHIGLLFISNLIEFFLYLISHDFRKINSRTKIFREMYSSRPVAHGGWLLAPWPGALSPCRRRTRRQEPSSCARAGHRGARTLPPSGTAADSYRRATWRQGFF